MHINQFLPLYLLESSYHNEIDSANNMQQCVGVGVTYDPTFDIEFSKFLCRHLLDLPNPLLCPL